MPRYFIELAYRGTAYCGWQSQPNQPTVQVTIEKALSILFRQPMAIVGCGRTDTGVHAAHYVTHFDYEGTLPDNIVLALAGLLPKDIVVYNVFEVPADLHARFSAVRRSYVYHIHTRPDPFREGLSWYCRQADRFDHELLQAAAQLLLNYTEFGSFCKTDSNNPTNRCTIFRSEWLFMPHEHRMEYHITANRFLRGMVRLIVGMCCSVALGKYTLDDACKAIAHEKTLPKPWSVPPTGLYLTEVAYRREAFIHYSDPITDQTSKTE